MSRKNTAGFTFVEIAIALVIIGLLTAAILTGKNLYESARVRQQISQIEQYNAAILTFRNKYGQLPGDLSAATADELNFKFREGTENSGDNDGVIETCTFPPFSQPKQYGCENILVWTDLSDSLLINESFTKGEDGDLTGIPQEEVGEYLPQLALGTYSYFNMATNLVTHKNWYTLLRIHSIENPTTSIGPPDDILAVQAYAIDTKLDDGEPLSGSVQTFAVNLLADEGLYFGSPSQGTNWCTYQNKYNLPNTYKTCQLRIQASGAN